MSGSTPERPLGDVLHRAFDLEFTPEHPELRPWHQHTFDTVTLVCTGQSRGGSARDRYPRSLRGLKRATWDRDFLEPWDWRKGPGWGVPPA